MANVVFGRGPGARALGITIMLVAGCGGREGDNAFVNGPSSGTGQTTGGTNNIVTTTGTGTSGEGGMVIAPPIGDLVPAESGGYKLGPAITGAGVTDTGLNGAAGEQGCGLLAGVVRDFKGFDQPGGHPDFQHFGGNDKTTGIVGPDIGPDAKPVYASKCEAAPAQGACPFGQQTTSKTDFDQWYRVTENVNKPYLIYFQFMPAGGGGQVTFDSKRFFPLDGAGWMDSGGDEDGKLHNFAFTTELHTKFKYAGGEKFTFRGDDDLWVFVNGKLGLDLGGLHTPVEGTLDLDASANNLGITKGGTYSLELFHAERHTRASNFRVDTTLVFVDCGTIPPDIH